MKQIILIIITLAALSCKKDDGRYKNWGDPPNPSINADPSILPGYWRRDPRNGEMYWVKPSKLSHEAQRNIAIEQRRGK